MQATFYQMNKRTNSTRQPGGTDPSQTLTVELKGATSIANPTLIINAVPTGWNVIWNYVYIPTFRRYYFINNWQWLNGVWEASCVVDVLASFKTQIGNLSEYVLRSSSEYNEYLVDLEYPTTAETRTDCRLLSDIYHFETVFAGGYYIVGIINNDQDAAQGAITYYQMTPAQLGDLKEYMMSDTFIHDQELDLVEVTAVVPQELLKTLYNPFQYIASCTWIPADVSDIPAQFKTLDNNIRFGWWRPLTQIQGYKINPNGYVARFSDRISISGHPQRFDRGKWLDHTPYSDRMLFYPPYGSIPINDDSIIGGDYLRIQIDFDLVLGNSVLTLFHDRPGTGGFTEMGVLARVSAPLGIPIQLAQNTIDVEGSLTAMEFSALGAAANGLVKYLQTPSKGLVGNLGDLIDIGKTALSNVGDVIASPVGQLQTSGSNGSLAQYCALPYFVEKYRIIADDDNTQKGRPLCAVKTLNTLTGFIMVDTPDISIPCFESERQLISSFMTNGFFWE